MSTLLTSEIPFLSDIDLSFSNRDTYSSQANTTTVDFGLILDYCRCVKPFPTGHLRTKSVDRNAINFVKRAMAEKPSDRLTGVDVLQDQWLRGCIGVLTAANHSEPTPDSEEVQLSQALIQTHPVASVGGEGVYCQRCMFSLTCGVVDRLLN